MLVSKNKIRILLFFCAYLLILPNNLFAASELQQSSTSSTSSSPAVSPPAGGGSGAHEKAQSGKMMGGLLIGAGGITVAIGYSASPVSWGIVAIGLVEMAGGAVAMMQNGKAASETAPKGLNFGGLTSGGPGPSTNSNLQTGLPKFDVEKCKPPVCNCNDDLCSKPQLILPPKDELEKIIRSGPLPDGTTLDEALAKLNDNYDKAKSAAAEFNKLSSEGAFDPNAAGGQLIASNDSSDKKDDSKKDEEGLGLVKRSNSNNQDDDSDSEPMIDALSKLREDPNKVLLMGMNAIDSKKGKALTIFERLLERFVEPITETSSLQKMNGFEKKRLKIKRSQLN